MIRPGPLRGSIPAVPSKSHTHRLLIAAALTDGDAQVLTGPVSDDIRATERCLDHLYDPDPVLDCGESGSTLRFLLPVAMAVSGQASFHCSGRLPERPVSPLKEEMEAHGCSLTETSWGWRVTGPLRNGDFRLPGDVSSQYISGLLLALPLISGDSSIEVTSPLQSASYVDLTLDVLKKSGISVTRQGNTFRIEGGQNYLAPASVRPEGDWSNSSFWFAADLMDPQSDIVCTGLDENSIQGDKKIKELLHSLPGIIDVSDTPDLVPPLAAAAAVTPGITVLANAARLRLKESDRLTTTARMLSSLGADIEELSDGLRISGRSTLRGGKVSGSGDHRIIMAAAVTASACDSPVTICGAEAVTKSYPSFFHDFSKLGGEAIEI